MATIKNQTINDVENALDIDALNQVESCYVYQKALAYTWLTKRLVLGVVVANV